MLSASLALAGLTAVALALLATPARAGLVRGEGLCSGEATLEGDERRVTVRESTSGTIEIPRSADVSYLGRISLPEGDDMAHSGRLRVELPPPLPSITAREWEGVTDETSDEGTTAYDLGDAVPSGVAMTVDVLHTQAGETCRAVYRVEVAGGPDVLAALSFLLTGASGALLVVAGRAAA